MGDDVSKSFFGGLPEAPWKKGEEDKMSTEDEKIAEGMERRAAVARRHSYKEINDRCPSCSHRTLFIGTGGYLTCSLIDCPEPGVGKAIDTLKAEVKDWEESFDLYNKACVRGGQMWKEATGNDRVWPDGAEMVAWLLEQLDKAEGRSK